MNYFDAFSGIGGFTNGIERAMDRIKCCRKGRRGENGQSGLHNESGSGRTKKFNCIGYSETDKYAKSIYQYHYPKHKDYGDITTINVSKLPDFNLFVGGFPCQAFSIAGKRQGFEDERGTLFFDVARICKAKRPEWILLENVKSLCSHDGGRTLGTIYRILTDIGYTVGWQVVNSCHFGVPQNRERIFIVGHLREAGGRTGEIFPIPEAGDQAGEEQPVSTAIDSNYWKGIDNHGQRTAISVGTWRTHKDGEGFRKVESGSETFPPLRSNTGAGHGNYVINETQDFKIRRLTPKECERLQGFEDGWTKYGIMDEGKVEISDTQRYKSLGNAVTVNVIEAIMSKILSVHLQ